MISLKEKKRKQATCKTYFRILSMKTSPSSLERATCKFRKSREPSKVLHEKIISKTHIIRFSKVEMKEKILKEAGEKGQDTCKTKPIRLTTDLLAKTLQARRDQQPIVNILKITSNLEFHIWPN